MRMWAIKKQCCKGRLSVQKVLQRNAKYSALQEEVQNRKSELLSKLSRHVGSSATHEMQGTKRSADTVPYAAHAVKVGPY